MRGSGDEDGLGGGADGVSGADFSGGDVFAAFGMGVAAGDLERGVQGGAGFVADVDAGGEAGGARSGGGGAQGLVQDGGHYPAVGPMGRAGVGLGEGDGGPHLHRTGLGAGGAAGGHRVEDQPGGMGVEPARAGLCEVVDGALVVAGHHDVGVAGDGPQPLGDLGQGLGDLGSRLGVGVVGRHGGHQVAGALHQLVGLGAEVVGVGQVAQQLSQPIGRRGSRGAPGQPLPSSVMFDHRDVEAIDIAGETGPDVGSGQP